jgi:hypothetical protein
VVITIEGGRTTLQLSLLRKRKCLVGQVAQTAIGTNRTLYILSEIYGSRFEEVGGEIKQVPYKVKKRQRRRAD